MQIVKNLLVIALGYLVACIAVPFASGPMMGNEFDLQMIYLGTMITMVFAAPGFVLLRGMLALAQIKFVGFFIVAGAINSVIAAQLLGEHFDTSLLFCGAIAGLVVWIVESAFPVGPIIITKRKLNDGT